LGVLLGLEAGQGQEAFLRIHERKQEEKKKEEKREDPDLQLVEF